MSPKVYYFGCAKPFSRGGHYLYAYPWADIDLPYKNWGYIDGNYAPVKNPWQKNWYSRDEEAQGLCSVTHQDGETLIAFWDRTGDKRGACNSAFLIDKIVDFKEGIELAQTSWPQLFKRFEEAGLELKEYAAGNT